MPLSYLHQVVDPKRKSHPNQKYKTSHAGENGKERKPEHNTKTPGAKVACIPRTSRKGKHDASDRLQRLRRKWTTAIGAQQRIIMQAVYQARNREQL